MIDWPAVATDFRNHLSVAHAKRTEAHPCKTGAIIRINPTTETITVIPLGCRQWACPDCGRRKMNVWRLRTRHSDPNRFITLTCAPRRGDTPQTALDRMKKGWPGLIRSIRNKCGTFEYVAIWELTEAGWPHLHILQRGDFVPQKWLSGVCRHYGWGRVADIRRITNGPHAAHYVTKYLTKSIEGGHGYAIFRRRIWCSRHYFDGATPPPEEKETDAVKYHCVRSSVVFILDRIILENGWTISHTGRSRSYVCNPDPENPRSQPWSSVCKQLKAL